MLVLILTGSWGRRNLLKEIVRLHYALAPTAEVHRTCDLVRLKGLALDVDSVMRRVPFSVSQTCREDVEIALKGILP